MDEYRCTLTEKALNYAVDNLNEDEKCRQEKISTIQRWLRSQKSLNARTDAKSVVRFLRCCKYDVEETKKRLTQYYKKRMSTPEWFQNRDPDLPVLQQLLDLGVYLPLRQRDSEGRLVIIVKAAVHDPQRYQLSDFLKLSNMIFDIIVEEDENLSVFGCVAILDLSGAAFGHTLQLSPSFISQVVDFWENCTPICIVKIDFVRAPVHVNLILDVFRRFMTERFQSRVHVLKDELETLHTAYSKDMLPLEYGGTDGAVQDIIDFWKVKLREKRTWLLEDEKHKADKPPTVVVSKYSALDDIW